MNSFKKLSDLRDSLPIDYKPNIQLLETLIDYAKPDSEYLDSLLFESLILALFTTNCGLSVLNIISTLKSFTNDKQKKNNLVPTTATAAVDSKHNKDENLDTTVIRNATATRNIIAKPNILKKQAHHPKLLEKWRNDKITLLKFTKFILKNSNFPLNYNAFFDPVMKLPLEFLLLNDRFCSNDNNATSQKLFSIYNNTLLMDKNYNLLLDYLHVSTPLLISLLHTNLDPLLFNNIISSYNKSFELTNDNKCLWYDFIDSKDTTNFGTITNCIDIINNFLEIFDMHKNFTLNAEISNSLFNISSSSTTKSNMHNENEGADLNLLMDENSMGEHTLSFNLFENNINHGILHPDLMAHISKRHDILAKILNVGDNDKYYNSPLLHLQFKLLCALVDPLTQPTPNHKNIISIDLLFQLFLGFLKPELDRYSSAEDGTNWKFLVCFNMEKIINSVMKKLNCVDFNTLNSINNSDESVHWRTQLHKWLPRGFNTQDLELLYMVNILATYTIYKLNEDLPIQLNPFLSSMVSHWKNLSCTILLGLEIDRLEEENETFDTPLIVRATVRSSTALRSIIATILNEHVNAFAHDFKHESLNTFMSPYGRKLCNGALYTDFRSHASTILALTGDLEHVTQLISDLQPGDRFDEDVKYMFEFEDYNTLPNVLGGEDDETSTDTLKNREMLKEIHNGNFIPDNEENDEREIRNYLEQKLREMNCHRRCNCIFSDDEIKDTSISDKNYMGNSSSNGIESRIALLLNNNSSRKGGNGTNSEDDEDVIRKNIENLTKDQLSSTEMESLRVTGFNKPHAVRTSNLNNNPSSVNNKNNQNIFDFDYNGKDWRDTPRGMNLYYNLNYEFIEKPNLDLVFQLTLKATNMKLDKDDSNLLLRLVASSVKNEQDRIIFSDNQVSKEVKEIMEQNEDGVENEKLPHNKNRIENGNEKEIITEITPDDIYEIWCEESAFERMMQLNYEVTFRLMDEMLMCYGYRRVLIWFITHLELSHSVIHYIFELVMGFRGTSEENGATEDKHTNTKGNVNELENKNENELVNMLLNDYSKIFDLQLPFSRQGNIELSEIERKMLIQEFLTNAAIHFNERNNLKHNPNSNDNSNSNEDNINKDEDEDEISLYSIGLMRLICFMIQAFLDNNKLKIEVDDSIFELQTLLMNWITIIPEAKKLFFQIKDIISNNQIDNNNFNNNLILDLDQDNNTIENQTSKDNNDKMDESSKVDSNSSFNKKLIELFPKMSHTNKEENTAIDTLKNYLKKFRFHQEVPIIGRKVIYEDGKILKIPINIIDEYNQWNDQIYDYNDTASDVEM
ncbi:hypothetical protein TBLA_0C04510 [Henningerozyma blattae CBS 6284]|uniref:Uncharacterized protein n=1 Tax=Henningerozyma blattae (strain ATCC 34711 / CBS 6284 / DSM 70876 / NBRC 10599 / NRRL Y-10934 / UCD 77-7) TaxID=1071380 RepID=I2H1J6_HENB6|nr:hypothetical protein TBLA_0C04510 [Tetrapisispora blattae CBS 6284]CCH60248.1 hypothetical protein TBLA_0C04510 [Tetrapisispora blattae CBS 6284]